ncbi:MAG: endopeptidase La [Clostridia bacterium]|nr:endopeptidase La [Clostridia bacterium]
MEDINKTNQIIKQESKAAGGENGAINSQSVDLAAIIAEQENVLPMVALKGLVVFPNIATSFNAGRAKSLAALSFANDSGKNIFVATQRNRDTEDPTPSEIYSVGVVCKIKRMFHFDGNVSVHIEGIYRAKITEYVTTEDYFSVKVQTVEPIFEDGPELEACFRLLREKVKSVFGASLDEKDKKTERLLSVENPDVFVNVAAFRSEISDTEKQMILQTASVLDRSEELLAALIAQEEIAEAGKRISERVRKNVEKGQKEYYLREQLRAIHQELGDDENEKDLLEKQIKEKNLPQEVEEKALKELSRMSKMNPSSPDYTVIRGYLDWILDLPFNEKTTDCESIALAKEVLDADHYGLEKVKERIIEYLAVMKLTGKIGGSILCLVGPPGVGKTSVATSIARATGRKFVRMSLGGVKDEAEIRGHRKTYVGAMPGRIIYGLKNAGSANPVFLLDEIDKISSDLRGDPASALLEVLDPEQNPTFRDRYLEVPFDLSDVLFVTTANSLDTIPAPLLDRMELIQLSGYTREEKLQIAKRYLIPKKLKVNGVDESRVKFTESAVNEVIDGYTREAGVRNLEREISAICRKIACDIAENGGKKKYVVTCENVEKYLGVKKYNGDDEKFVNEIGSATGLAWTSVGGTTLTIEVCLMPGKGDIMLTGKLGDVMKESARAAISYIRANALKLGIEQSTFTSNDIHIHVPEGATPKDGPSAGITMATAICSAFTGKLVNKNIAMTGEITLRGRVLAIGGLKEKALAAYRVGIRKVIIPSANVKDLEEIPAEIRKQIEFVPVSDINEVFKNVIIDF